MSYLKGGWKSDVHHCITDPVTRQDGRIVHLANAVSSPSNMSRATRGKSDDTILKDENIQRSGDRNAGPFLFSRARNQSLK